MSYDPSSRNPIPTGILVAKKASPANKPEPPPKRKAADFRQMPWLYIAIGGSVAWVLAILTIAICANSQGSSANVDPRLANGAAGVPGNPGQPQPFVAPEVDEFRIDELERKPGEPQRKLVRHLPVRNDDVPPDLVLQEEAFKPVPNPVPAPADVKPPKRAFDPQFANCDQIGTDVLFHKDPPAAFNRALKEKKLVFVVHLSGNFEDADFT